MREWGRIGEIEAAIGMTHLLASTLVRGQAFQVMRTPSMPSGSVMGVSVDMIGARSELFELGFCGFGGNWVSFGGDG
ncbi:hypothetical protein Hanom_Chr01g00074661 [Helianthus anomalus]